MKYILALDQGTTTARATLIDSEGTPVASATKEVSLIYPRSGWVEQDPMHLWHTLLEVISSVIEKAKIGSYQIYAIGVANQRETTIIWNKKTGLPIANAIVWQDRRTSDFCDYLKKQGNEAFIRSKTGLTLDPYFSASKLRFLLQHFSEARTLMEHDQLAFGTVDSWIIWNLTRGKVHVTDVSNASRTMLFNINKQCWDPELLQLFDIPASILPEVVSSCGRVGDAELPGFGQSIPITAIAGDQSASLFGQMCFEEGKIKTTFGTGCFILLNTGKKILPSTHQLLSTIAWKVSDKVDYALEGSIFIGGAAVQWLRDNLKIIHSTIEIEKLANTVDSSEGVYFVPAFNGLSAPHWLPNARGTIFGLSRTTQTAHLARAVLEGIAFQVADLLETVMKDYPHPMTEMPVDGGASTNDLLMQIQADVLNIPVIRPQWIDTTSLGIGYMAGLGAGFWKDTKELEKHRSIDRIFEPRPSEKILHAKEKWKKAVECVKLWEADE